MTGLGERTFLPLPATVTLFLVGGSSLGSRAAFPRLLRRCSKALRRRWPLTEGDSEAPSVLTPFLFDLRLRLRSRVDSLLVDEPETLALSLLRLVKPAVSASECAIALGGCVRVTIKSGWYIRGDRERGVNVFPNTMLKVKMRQRATMASSSNCRCWFAGHKMGRFFMSKRVRRGDRNRLGTLNDGSKSTRVKGEGSGARWP